MRMRVEGQVVRPARFTPLRYPGGKGKLAGFMKAVIEANGLQDGTYVEPFAGGAGIAMDLLLNEYVQDVWINDISRPVAAFWRCVLDDTEYLMRRVKTTRLTMRTWSRQKNILRRQEEHDDRTLGFATFFLNRTNRSGLLNGGVIGGRSQEGQWKIDARFNRIDLIARIEAIARMRRRISLSCQDAEDFVRENLRAFPRETLLYLDPPYYRKGKDLYYDYYEHEDHVAIASLMKRTLKGRNWIVSYDDSPEVRRLYESFRGVTYGVGYSARDIRKGREVMFFSPELTIPPLTASMQAIV